VSAPTFAVSRRLSAVLLVWLVLAPRLAAGQANIEGLQGAQFDFLAPGARSLGMGGAFVAVADDATAALANPAGLTQLPATEVSVEGRFRNVVVPFVSGGRLSGSPRNIGLDTSPTPLFGEASELVNGLSFASVVFARPQQSWAVAGYRHETLRFRSSFQSQGAFAAADDPNLNSRYFPIDASTDVTIVNYGGAAAVRAGIVSLGGGVSFYDLNIDSITDRYNFPVVSPGFFNPVTLEPASHIQHQVLDEGGTGVGFNVGALVAPNSRVQVGVSYRHGPDLPYRARTEPGASATFQAYAQADPQIAVPHVTTAGLRVRPGSTIVAVDYSHVQYSRIGEHFTDVHFAPELNPADVDEGPLFSIEDAHEIHLGFEHQFVNARTAPVLRFGAWFDPAHPATSRGVTRLLYEALADAAEDAWHYAVGGGVTVGAAVFSGAVDFSDRGNIASVSLVFRLP
jgi:hypothetical protein